METTQTSAFGPYSPVRQAGELYFISEQVGVDSATKQAAPDAAAQTRQALANLQTVLASAGLTPGNVIKTTLFLANVDDFAAVNAVYQDFFEPPRPARSTVAVAELPRIGGKKPLLIEIEAVACAAAEQKA